jgi:ATP-binding cassette subfamily C protein
VTDIVSPRHVASPARHPALERVRADVLTAGGLALLLGVLGVAGTFALLSLKMEIYQLVLPTGSLPTLAGLAVGFVLVAALVTALAHIREMVLCATSERIARGLAAPALLAAAGGGREPAPAAAQVTTDLDELRRGMSGNLCAALLDVAVLPALVLVLAFLHWSFAAFALLCGGLAAAASLAGARVSRTALRDANHATAAGAAAVADAMRNAEAVEAMGMLPDLERRWLRGLQDGAARLGRAQATLRLTGSVLGSMQTLSGGGALLLGAALALTGAEIGAGILVAMLLMGRVVDPFTRLGGMVEDWTAAQAAWRRLEATLSAEARQAAHAGAFACPAGRLVLDRVAHVVPDAAAPLFRDVRLVLEPGEALAIAGPPGSGKTTLLRLILGLMQPTTGTVFLDGHAVHQWERTDLARHVGYMPQEPDLPDGTVAEVIARLGEPEMGAVLEASRLAGAHAAIVALPQGYATPIGPGLPLSAGQRQRIALARALYGRPRLVVLDEPSAWLDAAGEAAVLRLLGQLRARGVSVVVASHRQKVLAAVPKLAWLGERPAALPAPEPHRLLPRPAAGSLAA